MILPQNNDPPKVSANIKIAPGLFFLAGLIAGFGFEQVAGVSWNFPGWAKPAGGALLLMGFGVFSMAFFALRKAGTAFDPLKPSSALVTNSIYHFSRNPAYLGGVLIYAGVTLLGSGLSSLLLLPAVVIAIQGYAIRREEMYLQQCFGRQYQDYQNRVRRWI